MVSLVLLSLLGAPDWAHARCSCKKNQDAPMAPAARPGTHLSVEVVGSGRGPARGYGFGGPAIQGPVDRVAYVRVASSRDGTTTNMQAPPPPNVPPAENPDQGGEELCPDEIARREEEKKPQAKLPDLAPTQRLTHQAEEKVLFLK